jgi:hypothetical protein
MVDGMLEICEVVDEGRYEMVELRRVKKRKRRREREAGQEEGI